MSKRYPGGIIRATPVTPSGPYEDSTAPGIWTLDQAEDFIRQGIWPTAGNFSYDPYFEYVTMLLPGNGTNLAQNNTFLDSSTNGFTITRNGNTTQGTFSPYGSNWSNYFAYNSTAVNYLVSSSVSLSGTFTIEGYVYWDGVGSLPNMFTVGDSALSTGLEVYLSSGNWVVYSNGASRITGAAGVVGQWTYIAVTRSGSTVTLYINGVSQGTWTSSATFSGTIKVGAEFYSSTYYSSMSGYISNFRVNNTTAINSVPTAPLTAISGTIFLTCQGNRFVDNSASPLTITVNGSPSVQRFSPFSPTAAYSAATIGGSGYFDGTVDSLDTGTTGVSCVLTGNFTVEAWVYPTAWGNYARVISGGASTFYWSLGFSTTWGGGLKINWYDGADYYSSAYSPGSPLNTWYHIAVVRTGSTIYYYINGVQYGSSSYSATPGNANGGFEIGDRVGATEHWVGYITDARVVVGTNVYGTGATITIPTAPLTAVTNTRLLLNFTNAGIIDNAMMNDLETVGNAQISTAQSKFGGGSISLSASGNTLRTQYNNPSLSIGSGDFTIEGWVYFSSTPSTNGVFQMSGTSGGFAPNQTANLALATNSSTTWQIYAKNTFTVSSTTTIPVGSWIHFALVRSGTTTVLYINGSSLITLTSDSTNYSTPYIGLGAIYDATSYPLAGYIDDLRITKGYARYTANFTPPTSQLQDQ